MRPWHGARRHGSIGAMGLRGMGGVGGWESAGAERAPSKSTEKSWGQEPWVHRSHGGVERKSEGSPFEVSPWGQQPWAMGRCKHGVRSHRSMEGKPCDHGAKSHGSIGAMRVEGHGAAWAGWAGGRSGGGGHVLGPFKKSSKSYATMGQEPWVHRGAWGSRGMGPW